MNKHLLYNWIEDNIDTLYANESAAYKHKDRFIQKLMTIAEKKVNEKKRIARDKKLKEVKFKCSKDKKFEDVNRYAEYEIEDIA